jgi:hypothetical protein
MMACLLSEGTAAEPRLSVYLNLDTLKDLRAGTAWPGLEGSRRDKRLKADGFEGVQLTSMDLPEPGTFLPYCGHARIDTPSAATVVAARHSERGDICLTVHAGTGLENEADSFRLVESILMASDQHRLPIFLETHRATVTQDLWRTVQIVNKFPEARFNADFSHYYCGQELVYGNWPAKLEFMEPLFARVAFIHGRIASPGCMQVPIDHTDRRPLQACGLINYLDDFKELWIRAMLGFLRGSSKGDVLIFAPELLSGTHYYARLFPNSTGQLVEESDRYAQALLYREVAHACFAQAQKRTQNSS